MSKIPTRQLRSDEYNDILGDEVLERLDGSGWYEAHRHMLRPEGCGPQCKLIRKSGLNNCYDRPDETEADQIVLAAFTHLRGFGAHADHLVSIKGDDDCGGVDCAMCDEDSRLLFWKHQVEGREHQQQMHFAPLMGLDGNPIEDRPAPYVWDPTIRL